MNKWIASLCVFLLLGGLASAWPQSPPVKPPPPRPRPLLLLAPFTKEKFVVRAMAATVQGAVVQVELSDGSRNAYDRSALVATLPWYAEADLVGGAVNLSVLGRLYDNAAREHPEFAAGIFAEKARASGVVESRDKDRAAKVSAVLSARYDPAAGYTIEDLRVRVRAADEAAALEPSRQAEIAQAIAPFRTHLANLEAGQTWINGQWLGEEEIHRQKAREEAVTRRRAFAESLQIPLPTNLLDAGQINRVLWMTGAFLGVPVLLGVVLMFRRRWVSGIVLILLSAAVGAWGTRALLSTEASPPVSTAAPGLEDEAVRALAAIGLASAQDAPVEPRLRVSEASANAFLSRYIRLQGEPTDGALNLRRVAVRFRAGGATVYETGDWRGHPVVVRQEYDIGVRGGQAVAIDGGTYVGQISVPDPVRGWLRGGLTATLGNFLKPYAASGVYALSTITTDGVNLTAVPARPTLQPRVVVEATPPPAAAPPTPVVAVAPTPSPSAPLVVATQPPASKEEDTPLPPLPAAGTTPGPDNTFYVYAIWDGINSTSASDIAKQMDRLREQFGKGNRYHRIGFAFVLGSEAQLRTICGLAKQKDLAVGLILGVQTHSGAAKSEVKEDFRAVQWRQEGNEWQGGKDPRDSMVPTPSRYCRLVRDALEKGQQGRCEIIRRVMDANPGVITCVNSTIEEELAGGGETDDAKLADYSPFAVTEFRDWLRHTGMYDADTGRYAGQGAPEHLTGPLISIKGKMRSPFYSARSPEDAPVGGSSFNQRFGTNFKTWRLKYWDLEAFQERITDEKFSPTPSEGNGYTEGGFDAPRKRNATLWWQTWSWDYQDNGNRYPPGPADAPAFGFRQVEVHNFVVDMLRVGLKARLPANLLFAHQIPGELVGAARDRSSASPVWTGFLPFNGTVGVTRFGFFDPKFALQYTKTNPQNRGWGIFEWHPKPFSEPEDPKLYQAATEHLRTYYQARCHHLFAGWWKTEPPPKGKQDFPLADSVFAKAIKDFMNASPDQPYPGTPR